jgi:hypothetical protein
MKPFLIPLLFVGSFLQAEDWPQFKGRSGNGVSTGKALPAEFSEKQNIAWKIHGVRIGHRQRFAALAH